MKIIELKCRCGADFKYEDSKDDWPLDNKKLFRYTVEQVAAYWLDAHRGCLPAAGIAHAEIQK